MRSSAEDVVELTQSPAVIKILSQGNDGVTMKEIKHVGPLISDDEQLTT
jgi:hypothetical protein